MPRQVRDASLETRTARARLKVRKDPYYRLIEEGLHIGYRRLASGPGTWIKRRYSKDAGYRTENLRTPDRKLIIADDYAEADGHEVMTFAQAQDAIRKPLAARRAEAAAGVYTVRDAVKAYFESKEEDGRDTADARTRANLHILPQLGDKDCAGLTAEGLHKWHRALANSPPRRRARAGEKNYGPHDKTDRRRRQASANRVLTILKAALNHAYINSKIASDGAWRKTRRFKNVDKARLRYLDIAEAQRLINACAPDFRLLVQAALQSGCRYGQLTALTVSDFNRDAETLRVSSRKGDGSEKVYHVHLTDEGANFFRGVCAGRAGNALMFQIDGREWRKSEQKRPMADAIARARIKPRASFHALRHTWASHAVMNGVPLMVVAKNLGHADTRMVEKHYGHLAPSYIADAIRAGAPRFGLKTSRNVTPLAGRT